MSILSTSIQFHPYKSSHFTYPVLVNDIDDCHQFTLMGPEGNVGDAADLNVALEHLEDAIWSQTW